MREKTSRPTPRERALRLLARREYSRAELAARLASWGCVSEEITALLDEFEAFAYLSDERFAAATVRHRSGQFAKRRIVGELRAKGVTAETAAEAVAASEQDDYATARALWLRRFGRAPESEKEKARQVRFLQARGFAPSLIYRVLREAGARVEENE